MTRNRRIALAAAVVIVLAVVTWLRIRLIDGLQDQGFFSKYVTFADLIRVGNIPADRVGDVSPAYLWLMIALRFFTHSIEAIRNLQIIGVTVAALFCALAAKRLGGWVAAIVAATLVLANRATLIVATEIEPETLILLLGAAAILLVLKRRFAFAGLLVGLSVIARPVALLTLVLVAAWLFFRESRRAAALFIGSAIPPIVVVLAINAAIAGHAFIMQPGGQLYDANNPLSTGCAGVLPRIVADLNVSTREPDFLHVAYRLVAARALGKPMNAKDANRFWTAKTLAFWREYPAAELRLLMWKAVLAVHHYDIYDLITTKQKSLELARYPAIPFGVAFVLALAAFALRRARMELVPIALFGVATFVALVAFNVSTRQRNALLAPLAVLGGIGAAEIVRLVRERRVERALTAFGAVLVLTPLLGIEGTPMREDAYMWSSALRASRYRTGAFQARAQGNAARAIQLATAASILDTAEPSLVSEATLRRFATRTVEREESPQALFDLAIALQKANAWLESEAVLSTIADYQPRRENRAVSSVSYYRARAAIRLGAPAITVRHFIEGAEREAPGDPYVLALRLVTGDRDAARALDAIHDPFTRDLALAAAFEDVGDRARSVNTLQSLAQRFPEWKRPGVLLRHALRTAQPRSGSSGAGR